MALSLTDAALAFAAATTGPTLVTAGSLQETALAYAASVGAPAPSPPIVVQPVPVPPPVPVASGGGVSAGASGGAPVTATSSLQTAADSLALIAGQQEGVDIIAALLNEDYDDSGTLVEVVDVSFTINGRPGVFSVHPPFEVNWSAIAFFDIGVKAAYINGIYDGLTSKDQLPAGPVGAPRPRPGVPF